MEDQTISGLKAWQKHFARVIAYAICNETVSAPLSHGEATESGLTRPEFELVPLPDTYNLRTYLQKRVEVAQTMLDLMQRTDCNVFSYGGWIGDPGEIAASVARKHGIPHAVWLDRVESQVVTAEGGSLPQRVKSQLKSAIIARNEQRAVRGAELGMLHGTTVFDHFKAISKAPVQIEDIHLSAEDRIGAAELAEKIAGCESGLLKILYCGRAAPMKGGFQWVETLALLQDRGVDFRAEWLGDGPELDGMKRKAADLGLTQDHLHFIGFVTDREVVKAHYRQAQILMFCHLSDESPRNLIESLHLGTPLIGYADPFAKGLVAEKGAGELVRRGDKAALANVVEGLARDRGRLADLIERAGASASALTREQVFQHRSDIVAQHLSRD